VAPELTYSVKPDAVEGLVTTLRTLQGDDVADPVKSAEYGLDAPPYRAILTVQPGGQEARQAAVRIGNEVPEKSGSRYARLGDTGPVYIVPQWTVQRLFPTLGTLLDLRMLQVPQEEVTRLTLYADGQSWSLERQAPATATSGGTPGGYGPTQRRRPQHQPIVTDGSGPAALASGPHSTRWSYRAPDLGARCGTGQQRILCQPG
jgi:hypothetical protein